MSEAAAGPPHSGLAARWRSVRPYLLVGAAVVLVIFVGPRFCRTPLLPAGAQVPAFSVRFLDPARGRLTAGDLRGRTCVLIFWTAWCPACKGMLPEVDRLAERRSGVRFVAIHSDGEVAPRAVAARVAPLRFLDHVLDGETILGSYRVSIFPTTYVVGSDGRVCDGFAGRADARDVARAVDACR